MPFEKKHQSAFSEILKKSAFCLFSLLINPRPESGTRFHKKSATFLKKGKTIVWIKWPTQGRASYV